MISLPKPITFLWDSGNDKKNLVKHGVTDEECEQVFFDPLRYIINDRLHSDDKEDRYIILGHTNRQKILFIAFTIRSNKIRIISARGVNKKERKWYEEKANTA